MFKIGSKLTKDANFYDHLGQSDALFGMVNEEAHKERFKMVADLFSKRWARNFESLIDQNVCLSLFIIFPLRPFRVSYQYR